MSTKSKSYASHIVHVWINNDESLYHYFQQFTDDESKLAEEIENYIQDLKDNVEGLTADLIGVAMDDIDYRDVARKFID